MGRRRGSDRRDPVVLDPRERVALLLARCRAADRERLYAQCAQRDSYDYPALAEQVAAEETCWEHGFGETLERAVHTLRRDIFSAAAQGAERTLREAQMRAQRFMVAAAHGLLDAEHIPAATYASLVRNGRRLLGDELFDRPAR